MKKKLSIIISLIVLVSATSILYLHHSSEHNAKGNYGVASYKKEKTKEHKTLIAYFSATGTTKKIAELLSQIINADLYEIKPTELYTNVDLNYQNPNSRTSIEQSNHQSRPAISGDLRSLENYDCIFLGYPIWHGQAPRIIATFLEGYDFSNKTIIPFCTSQNSGIGTSDQELYTLAPSSANWLHGRHFTGQESKEELYKWINHLKE